MATRQVPGKMIPGSTLLLHPDAGHAFRLRETGFLSSVQAFLGGT